MNLERTGNVGNKLKNIFSNNPIRIDGQLTFKDGQSYKNFLDALEIVQNQGKVVEVSGVSTIVSKAVQDQFSYPLFEHIDPIHVCVGPSVRMIPIKVYVDNISHTVVFHQYKTKTQVITETDKNSIVYFRFVVPDGDEPIQFTYKIQPQFAETIFEVVANCAISIALMKKIFVENASEQIETVISVFENTKKLFEKAIRIAELIKESEFCPAHIKHNDFDGREIKELYALLVEQKVVRVNTQNPSIKDGEFSFEEPPDLKVGGRFETAFASSIEYEVWGEKITVYTANLLCNAIVKRIETQNGETKLLYGDVDSEPMYISYRAFLDESEAIKEINQIMKHREKYKEALTMTEYLLKEKTTD